MNNRRVLKTSFALILCSQPLFAANFTWDTVSGDGAAVTAGSGVWDMVGTNAVWNNAGANVPWAASNTAIFGGTDGSYSISVDAALASAGMQFTASGYTLSATTARTITNAGSISISSGKTATIGSNVTVSRAAGIAINGGGTLNITGTVSNSTGNSEINGGTTIDVQAGGILSFAASAVVGSLTNNVANNNATLNINGGTARVTGNAGNFILGNLNVVGSVTNSTINLNAGSLEVFAASPFGLRFGSSGSVAGTVTGTFNLNGGILQVPQISRVTPTAAGVINATLNLNGGTVRANKANLTFLQNLNFANVQSGGVIFDSNGFDITVAQNLLDGSGGGGLEKLGSGTLTLTGTNTFTGLTKITAGVLQLGSGGTSGIVAGAIENNAQLTINKSNATVLAGGISGTGNVVIQGGGTVGLAGTNTYTGTTAVNAGRLDLTGSVTSDITLATGAHLGGEGTSTKSIVFNGVSNLYFDPSTPAALQADTVDVSAATVAVQLSAASPSATGIVVLNAPGGITGAAANFQFTGRGSVYLNGPKTQVLFDYAPATLKWKGNDGTNPTFWDTTTTINWTNGVNPDVFYATDAVTFDDTATSFVVDVAPTGVIPRSILFDNTVNPYFLKVGAIQGVASLVKQGTNDLNVANENSFTGGTTITAGTLRLGNGLDPDGSVGTGGIVNNSALVFGFGGNAKTVPNAISGTGTVTQTGTGTVTLTGNNTYSGLTTIAAGTLQIGVGGTDGSLGTGSVTNNGVLAINRSDNFSFTTDVSGIGGLTKLGTNIITLPEANTYDGVTTISTGALLVTHPDALGSSVGGTIVSNAAALQLQGGVSIPNEVLTVNGGGLGAGFGVIQSLSANNTLGGNITALGAIVRVASDADLLTLSGNILLPPGLGDQFVLQGVGNIISTGVISGISRVTCSSNGTGTRTLSGANTYTGQTLINGGTLSVASLNSVNGGTPLLPSSNLGAPTTAGNGTITVGSTNVDGRLLYTGSGETTDRIIALNGTTGNAILEQAGSGLLKFTSGFTAPGLGTKTLFLTGSTTGTGEVAGSIVDNSATNKTNVTKTGTGTWTLSGTNSHTGATTVSAGTLAISGAGSISLSPTVSVAAGATLDVTTATGFAIASGQKLIGGTNATAGLIKGATATAAGSTLAPGGAAGNTGILKVEGNLNLAAGTIHQFDLAAQSDQIQVQGDLVLEGTVDITNATSVTGTFPLITYTGALSGTGLVLGTTPPGLVYSINTSTPGVVNLVVSTPPPAGYAAWQASNWPGETNASIIGEQADPDGDGVVNLLEYALGMTPTTASQVGLPSLTTVTVGADQYLALVVKRPLGSRPDIVYAAEFSDTMAATTWAAGVTHGAVIDNGDGTESITFRDQTAIGTTKRFGRLRVSNP